MKFFFQKRNKNNNDDGQQPVPPQENQPPQQPVPPQQPQYQQPVPPQQPQYQQPIPPQNYDPYAFQREQYKKQRNRRLIAQGLVALILLLAVFDGNPVNSFVDTTPVGEVVDSVKNRLNSVLGRDSSSSNNTSNQNGDAGSPDNSNENNPAGAAASEVSCDFDTTPYLSPFDGALGNNNLGVKADSPYFRSGVELFFLFTLVNNKDIEPDSLVTEDYFVDEFIELSSQTIVNHAIEKLNNLIVKLQELEEQSNNDPNFQYSLELQKVYAELLKDELARFYIGNINDNEEVTKIKIFLNRNIISEFELKDIKQQPIFISYYDSSNYSDAIYSSDNVLNEERIEETKALLGEKDGLFVSIDVEGIVGHNDFLNLAIQIGDDQGCWSDIYSVDTQYQSAYFLTNESIEEIEESLAAEEVVEEEDNNGGVVGSGPFITIPDNINLINPGNLINPNILEGVNLLSDCSNDVLVPYISGGSHNSNTSYKSIAGPVTVARNADGYVRSIYGPELFTVEWLFTLEVTDNCPFDNVSYPLLNSVEVNYVNRIENPASSGFATQSKVYPINVAQYYDGIRIWAEMLNVERDTDCAMFYDTYVANGTYAKQIPLNVWLKQSSANAPFINEYSIGFDPLAANLCPGTYSIFYTLLDASGNVTEVKYLNNIILEVNVIEELAGS